MSPVTRFIGLAPVGNQHKQKFLHALSLVPAEDMSLDELLRRPPDATLSPFLPPPAPNVWHGSLAARGIAPEAELQAGGGKVAAGALKPAWASRVEEEEAAASAARVASSTAGAEQYWRYSGAPPTKRQKGVRRGPGGGDEDQLARPCLEFSSKGSCQRGDSCRFMHALPNGAPLPRGLCFDFFTKGQCERGEQCKFKHSLEEEGADHRGAGGGGKGEGGLDGAHEAATGGEVPGPPETKPCLEFASKGSCSRGPSCRFMHSLPSGAPLPKGLCFDFFSRGACERGYQCHYRHSLDAPPDGPKAPSGLAERRGAELATPCWFCLASPSVDTHLVAGVGDHCYLALPKGPLVDGHVLVLPIEHFPNFLSVTSDALLEAHKYADSIKRCFRSRGQEAVVFERYLQLRGAVHAHLNFVPVPPELAGNVAEAFFSGAQAAGFSFDIIPADSSRSPLQLVDALKRMTLSGPFFRVELPDGSHLVHPVERGSRHPMQFGREVLAQLLGVPERADWKSCKDSQTEEEVAVARFKEAFSMFDPFG